MVTGLRGVKTPAGYEITWPRLLRVESGSQSQDKESNKGGASLRGCYEALSARIRSMDG